MHQFEVPSDKVADGVLIVLRFPEFIKAIMKTAEGKVLIVRRCAAKAFIPDEEGASTNLTLLKPLCRDTDPVVRLFAAGNLARYGSDSDLADFEAQFNTEADAMKAAILETLAENHDAKSSRFLLPGLSDKSKQIRTLAHKSLVATTHVDFDYEVSKWKIYFRKANRGSK